MISWKWPWLYMSGKQFFIYFGEHWFRSCLVFTFCFYLLFQLKIWIIATQSRCLIFMYESELLKGFYKDFAFPNGVQRNMKGKWWLKLIWIFVWTQSAGCRAVTQSITFCLVLASIEHIRNLQNHRLGRGFGMCHV